MSFDSTLNVLEGLLEYERSTGANGDVAAARVRGEEYLLERRLLRRLSDGEIPREAVARSRVPERVVSTTSRACSTTCASARPTPDERMTEALDILESKRDADGRWSLDHAYHDASPVDLGETQGQPSRWITLRALRVLRWAEDAGGSAGASAASA